MHRRLDLNLDIVGRYPWGSLICDFPLAAATARTAIDSLVALSTGALHFSSAEQGRAVLSLMHEVVHYLQDLTTGAGHWDYLAQHRAHPELLSCAQLAGRLLDAESALENSRRLAELLAGGRPRELWESLRTRLLLADQEVVDRRNREIAGRLSKEIGAPVPISDVERLLSFRTILETEAMATVFATVIGMRATAETHSLLSELASLWNPAKMDDVYAETFATALGSIEFSNELDKAAQFLATSRMVQLITDLALSYPPPSFLDDRNLDWEEFDPGIRFSRMWRATLGASGEEGREFAHNLSSGALEECERQLLLRVDFPYPTSREIYSAWIKEFEGMPRDPDDSVTQIRLEAAHARMIHPILPSKSYATLVDFQLPLLIQGSTTTQHLWQGPRAVDGDLQSAYLVGVMQWNREYSLVARYYADEAFTCPSAGLRMCAAARSSCLTGWSSLVDLPAREGCVSRRQFEFARLPLV